jgi:RNA-directed DNA polymerase
MINKIKHLAFYLRSSEQELLYIINNIDKYYYAKRQPKTKYGEPQRDARNNIKYRDLCPSKYPLKRIQQRINLLLQQIELPNYAYGSVKGSNHILNARGHLANKYFFSVDLKNFFPYITHRQVFRMFLRNKFSPTVSRILTQLTTYGGGLPQGAPTSPVISNLVFVETGQKLLDVIKDYHITFTSFLDDLTFSSKNDFKQITPQLLEIIKSGGFYLNHKKIHYKTSMPEVTGILIHNKKLWPIESMKIRAKENPHIAKYLESIYA